MIQTLVPTDEKIQLAKYYMSTTCVCGKQKRRVRWDCKDCLVANYDRGPLSAACELHFWQAKKYLERIPK